MTEDIFTHRHKFAVWAAARASQRGFAGVETLRKAIEQCGIKQFLADERALETDREQFETLHRCWGRSIEAYFSNCGLKGGTYGRAAKLIAVYLKCMVVIGGNHESTLAFIAHPPIDRILLKNMARSKDLYHPNKSKWRRTNWTQLDESEYYELAHQLWSCVADGQPFWSIEEYWTIIENA